MLMDWKIFIATFTTIFIAELGDKTQFAAFALAAESKSTLSIILGAILALSIATLLGVLAGSLLANFINPEKIKYISGSAFILMGLWILLK